MASLTFDGFDVDRNAILYRGGLGAQYSFSPDGAAATFKFPHGSRIRMRRGPFASRSSLVVIGVTTAERHELVVHDEEGGVAHILAQCFTFNDLCEKHDPAPVAAHEAFPKAYVEMAGPLEYRYAFNTDSVVLDPKYGVSSGTRLHIGSLKSDATVVGEFLSVLWVTLTSRESAGAVPLIGCTNEATLLNLHNVRDSDAATGSISPRTPRTPGRARGSGAAPFSVDETRQVATCVGAFGAHLEVAIDDASLAPFGVVHKSRMVATKGLDVGKGFTVVGVKSGSLYILGDGDRKVTCCRNCATKADLEKLYGFEPAGRGRSISRGSEPQVIPAPRLPYTTSPAVPLPDANAPEAPPLRSSSTLKNCWTSHGRQAFDISPAACGVFGFAHGQTVVATVGGESGKRFHVFGVRHGVLWVVPEGAEYATPLRHCTTKTEVDQAFGFVGNGKCDLSWLYEAPKPMGTPVSSPRRGDTAPNSPEQPVPSPLVDAREDPTDIAAPPAVVVSAPRALAPAPPKVIIPKLPISVVDQRQPSNEPVYTVAPDASSAVLPASVPSRDRSVDTEAFRIGAMPVTRHFLKAYALFKLRLPSEAVDPQAFHGFYAEAPQQRLNAAMSALASAESQWRLFEEKKRKCTFSNATVDEMIEALNRAPHICP